VKIRIAHISDPHLAPLPPCPPRALMSKRFTGWLNWKLRRHRLHRRACLDAVVADLQAQEPDLILCTGDLANLSLPEEYEAARRWLAGLGTPDRVLLVPGNHDAYVPGAFEAGCARWAPWMGGIDRPAAFPYLLRRPGLAILGLSTAEPSPPGFATGRIGADQLRRAELLLERARREGRYRIVLLHHPPLAGSEPRKRLIDREAFLGLLMSCGAELVLCGHEHRFREGRLAGPRGAAACFMAPSASLRDPRPGRSAGYLLFELDLETGTLDCILRAFDPGFERIGPRARSRVTPEAGARTAAVAMSPLQE